MLLLLVLLPLLLLLRPLCLVVHIVVSSCVLLAIVGSYEGGFAASVLNFVDIVFSCVYLTSTLKPRSKGSRFELIQHSSNIFSLTVG